MNDITLEVLSGREIVMLKHYEILQNNDDEILITMPPVYREVPAGPLFYYDGRKHGILVCETGPVAVCDHIHPEVRNTVEKCESILFAAVEEGKILAEFEVPLVWQPRIQELAIRLLEDAGEEVI